MKYQTYKTGYRIPMQSGHGFTIVPNRKAAGFLKTAQKQTGRVALEIGKLARFGTMDRLATLATIAQRHEAGDCPCCGSVMKKYRMNPSKRWRLNLLREKYQKNI